MAIKMRINNTQESVCCECNTKYMDTAEMYDLCIHNKTFTLCRKCVEKIFHKTLRASVLYSGKIKTKQDQERIKNENKYNNGSGVGTMSITEALKGVKTEE